MKMLAMSNFESLNAGDYATFGDLLQYEKHCKLLLSQLDVRRIWHKGISSTMLGGIPHEPSRKSLAYELLPEYKLPYKTEILPPNQGVVPHTRNMPHQCPAVPPELLLNQRP